MRNMQKDVDYFSVFFDTYNDNQNGFQFVVTSANVQSDARLGPNLGNGGTVLVNLVIRHGMLFGKVKYRYKKMDGQWK